MNPANVTISREGVVKVQIGSSFILPNDLKSMIEANDTKMYSLFNLKLLDQ